MRKNNSKLNFMKNRWANFLVGDQKSQNVLFHLPEWASAQKVRLHHWMTECNKIIVEKLMKETVIMFYARYVGNILLIIKKKDINCFKSV